MKKIKEPTFMHLIIKRLCGKLIEFNNNKKRTFDRYTICKERLCGIYDRLTPINGRTSKCRDKLRLRYTGGFFFLYRYLWQLAGELLIPVNELPVCNEI